ncbi:hypothetical protein M758_1G282600 [Ceratodon purpureus]|uniref:Uncharacterized protein n=1 Tax=Ceratodon purpureus TaxID=3225 RepID=A0A8T0JDM1_CERPU|nr:hypothetical protein KC19_1G291100 [Ceratodon purpureus]KAG0631833.1 hypothetical protein M758_1G282600 [Ceratodon purpureus]
MEDKTHLRQNMKLNLNANATALQFRLLRRHKRRNRFVTDTTNNTDTASVHRHSNPVKQSQRNASLIQEKSRRDHPLPSNQHDGSRISCNTVDAESTVLLTYSSVSRLRRNMICFEMCAVDDQIR